MRWTYALFPTNAYAQDSEMGLAEYEDFVYNACLGDINDPSVTGNDFQQLAAKDRRLVKGQKTGPCHRAGDRSDDSVWKDRTFINCDGHENMPDGEVFTGPVEDSIEGQVYFSYPTIYNGREVDRRTALVRKRPRGQSHRG